MPGTLHFTVLGHWVLLIFLRAQPCLFHNGKWDKEEKVHLATFCFFQTNLCNMVVPDVLHYDYCRCQRICQDHRNNLCSQTHCLKEQRQENNHYYLQIQYIKIVVTTIIPPLVIIVLDSLTAIKLTSNYFEQASNTVEPPCATNSQKQPPRISDWLSKAPKLSQSKPSNWDLS